MLARQTARRRGGDVVLTSPGGATGGATAVLPGVVSAHAAFPVPEPGPAPEPDRAPSPGAPSRAL